ncbi:MAG: DUF1592 domain-containing protein [Myxococcota bacterium]
MVSIPLLLFGCGGGEDPAPTTEQAAPWATRRLTREQLQFTLLDTLGVDITPRLSWLPQEVRAEGFTNTDIALVATADHIEGWSQLAPWVAEQWDVEGWRANQPACDDPSAACVNALTEALLTPLLRRTATTEDVERLGPLWTVAADEDLGVAGGLQLILEATLQSTGFIYHIEEEEFSNGVREVTGTALANRLAYFVWQSAPDEALRRAALAGELDSVEGRLSAVDRMLADETKARRATDRFARDWLALDGLLGLQRNDADADVTRAMHEAAVRSWHHHLWTRDASVYEVLDATEVVLDARLAPWYDVPPPDDWSVIDAGSLSLPRSGVLTWPGVLTSTADSDVGGIVARGLFIREHLFCDTALHPPEELNLSEFRTHLAADATERDYSEDRLARADCAGCHAQFDPLAYGLVPFDGVGRFDATVRGDGWVPDAQGPLDYEDAEGLGAILATSSRARECLTRKHLQMALGRPLEAEDQVTVDAVHRAAEAAGGAWPDLVRAIVAHPMFVTVAEEL